MSGLRDTTKVHCCHLSSHSRGKYNTFQEFYLFYYPLFFSRIPFYELNFQILFGPEFQQRRFVHSPLTKSVCFKVKGL